ncbi:hypothetical protein BCD67_23045 [Oscillatoriales cyanobacterium USR001]|nr:hypothetical protein BCD67_23045 [Oscillatoriales cyanobacterium USR001]
MNITQILIAWLVTSVSFFIISKLPIGVEIDNFKKAMISAAVFGLLNAVLSPILFATKLVSWLTLGVLGVVVNAIVFGLAAWLVEGFRLNWGIWSALLGAIALGFINSLLYQILASVRL